MVARLLCPQLFLCYRFSWLFAIFLWNLSFPSTVFQFTNFNCLTRSNSKSISGLLCVAFLYCPISTLWFLSHTVSFDSDFFLNLFVLSGRWIQVDFFWGQSSLIYFTRILINYTLLQFSSTLLQIFDSFLSMFGLKWSFFLYHFSLWKFVFFSIDEVSWELRFGFGGQFFLFGGTTVRGIIDFRFKHLKITIT